MCACLKERDRESEIEEEEKRVRRKELKGLKWGKINQSKFSFHPLGKV